MINEQRSKKTSYYPPSIFFVFKIRWNVKEKTFNPLTTHGTVVEQCKRKKVNTKKWKSKILFFDWHHKFIGSCETCNKSPVPAGFLYLLYQLDEPCGNLSRAYSCLLVLIVSFTPPVVVYSMLLFWSHFHIHVRTHKSCGSACVQLLTMNRKPYSYQILLISPKQSIWWTQPLF